MNSPTFQVIIPMSGTGERFKRAGYNLPKPLIPVDEQGLEPIIAHLIRQFPRDVRFVFVCNSDHLRDTPLAETLKKLAPEGTIVPIAPHKLGPVHAVLEAKSQIRDDLPTIVNYCDFSFSWDFEHFVEWTRRESPDGAVVCYKGFHPHYFGPTNYAYCRTDSHGRVLEVREKENFTADRTQEFASSGTYYFRDGASVKKYFAKQLETGQDLKGEHYVSLVYNGMIRKSCNVRVYQIDTFLQWGTPEDLQDWQYWSRAFDAQSRLTPLTATPSSTLLMPMAGLGSRFKEGLPKPLIPLHGQPLFLSACSTLPQGGRRVFVVRREIEAQVRPLLSDTDELVVLEQPTDGQATTCAAALPALEKQADGPLWVTSCDHGMAITQEMMRDLESSSCDLGIVGVRRFPGARRSPKAFAYLDAPIIASNGGASLPPICKVSVKEPLSEDPRMDPVLIGTFYFRSKRAFAALLTELLDRNIRVNGERYLDSIVNLAIEKGLDIRLIDSPAYYCWGTPEFLEEYRYWYRFFRGIDA